MNADRSTNKAKAIRLLAAVTLIGAALLAGGFGATYAQEAPSPWLIAFPENEAVEGFEWPE